MALVGFARVSTTSQDLTIQVERLTEIGCSKIFQGKHSGKAETNKQALDDLLGYVREGDTVVATKLDRLGRSLSQVLLVIDQLNEKGVALKALDQNIDTNDNDPMAKAMVQLIGMFAELERNFIVSRTQEGRKATGNLGGRPNSLDDKQKKTIKSKYHGGSTISALAREYNVSRPTIGRIVGTVPINTNGK